MVIANSLQLRRHRQRRRDQAAPRSVDFGFASLCAAVALSASPAIGIDARAFANSERRKTAENAVTTQRCWAALSPDLLFWGDDPQARHEADPIIYPQRLSSMKLDPLWYPTGTPPKNIERHL